MNTHLRRSSTERPNRKKGLTLVELLTAMAIIPVVLIAASTLSLQVAKMSSTTFLTGQTITEMENVRMSLERWIVNGISQNGTQLTSTSTCANPSTGSVWCYELFIQMPDPTVPAQIYRFEKTDVFGNVQTTLKVSFDNRATFSQVSYSGFIDTPLTGNPQVPTNPFSVDLPNSLISINFNFHTPTVTIPSTQTIAMKGGNGVP